MQPSYRGPQRKTVVDFTRASPVISVTSFSGGGDKYTGREGITVSTGREQNTSLRCQGGCECEGQVTGGKGEARRGQKGKTQNSIAEAVWEA